MKAFLIILNNIVYNTITTEDRKGQKQEVYSK